MLERLPIAPLWTLDREHKHRECETIKAQALATLARSRKLLAEADQVLSRIRKGALIGASELDPKVPAVKREAEEDWDR